VAASRDVRVVLYIAAPIDRVFDALADRETFLRSEEGTTAKLLRAGKTERNGLGCSTTLAPASRSELLLAVKPRLEASG
jgi:hypothetical protein